MPLILIQTIVQAVSSTLTWLGIYIGIRALPGAKARKSRWIVGSAVIAAAWLVGMFLLGAAGVFRNNVLPPRIPMALLATLLLGYLLLLSPTFRRIIAVPQHWLTGIQMFRVLGGGFVVRYFAGQLPGLFALPAGRNVADTDAADPENRLVADRPWNYWRNCCANTAGESRL
jgi:hypothetical protein